MQRRDFITTAGRYALYGTLGVIAAVSLKKARLTTDKACPPGISCRDCLLLRGCTLDQADEARSSVNNEINS